MRQIETIVPYKLDAEMKKYIIDPVSKITKRVELNAIKDIIMEPLMLSCAEVFAKELGFKRIAVEPSSRKVWSAIKEFDPGSGKMVELDIDAYRSTYDQMPLENGYKTIKIQELNFFVKKIK